MKASTISTGDMSLHQQIVNDVEARILAGDWPPGHRIPFEMELTEQYNCSRMTVNKAMTQLARAGLIERKRKSGSFVSRPRGQSAVLEINEIRSEVEALGKPYRYELQERKIRRASAEDRTLLGIAVTAKVMDIVCLHYAGDRPFCLEERVINLQAVPQASDESFIAGSPGGWLLQQVPWSDAEHTIRAVNADRRVADIFGVREGAACLVIERRTSINGNYITHVRLTYLGSVHALVARFTPSQSN